MIQYVNKLFAKHFCILKRRSYINFIMSTPQSQTLKKSQTHSFALPHINKARLRLPVNYKTSQSASKTRQHNSVFLQKIKDLTKDTKYEQMETSSITQQQKQLKQIVRDFNQETYHILGRYLDKASMNATDRKDLNSSRTTQMRRSTRGHSTSMMVEVRDKQIFNSNETIQICKKQLQALEKRSENLKYITTEEFWRKIQATKQEIQNQKEVIKEILRQNKLRGQQIKKEDDSQNHYVSMLEYEKYILQKKKERLVNDSKYVSEEEQNLKKKHAEGDKKIQEMNVQYQKLNNQDKNARQQIQLKKKLEDKRRQLFYKKERKEILKGNSSANPKQEQNVLEKSANTSKDITKNANTVPLKQNPSHTKFQPPASAATVNKYQHQYLKLLKQLDEVMNRSKSHEESMANTIERVEQNKIQILAYEQKLAALKKKNAQTKKSKSPDNENDKNKSPEKQVKKGLMDSLFG